MCAARARAAGKQIGGVIFAINDATIDMAKKALARLALPEQQTVEEAHAALLKALRPPPAAI